MYKLLGKGSFPATLVIEVGCASVERPLSITGCRQRPGCIDNGQLR